MDKFGQKTLVSNFRAMMAFLFVLIMSMVYMYKNLKYSTMNHLIVNMVPMKLANGSNETSLKISAR